MTGDGMLEAALRAGARLLLALVDGPARGDPQAVRAAWMAYRHAPDPSGAVEAARIFVRQAIRINAHSAAVAVAAERSARLGADARQAPGDRRVWTYAALAALELNLAADAFADPAFLALAGRHLDACLAAAPPPSTEIAPFLAAVREMASRVEPLRLRYRARLADAAGSRPERGRAYLRAARDAAAGDAFLEIVLAIESGRYAAAAQRLDDYQDHPLRLAELNLRAGRPAIARKLLAAVPVDDVDEPAWTALGRRAAIALALGETADAAGLATRAVAAFEESSAGLTRDYYRAVAADHVSVAEAYHVGVLARLRLGDPVAAFGLADRCRALALRAPGRTGSPAAVRAWQAAGARLAATHERLAANALRADPHDAPNAESDVLAAMLAAEDAVVAAEDRLTPLAAPVSALDRIGRTLREVQRALPADAALLLYHCFDQDLVVFAVRSGAVTVHHRVRDHRSLIRSLRRLHAACADFTDDGRRSGRLAARLAKELIDPVAGALTGVRRLYIAPGGNLTLLPFAVLPLDGVPLGERFVLSSLPAAALLTRPGAGLPPRRDGPALLVGDPAYDRWPRLPGARVEVGSIAADHRIVLTGEGATARNVAEHTPACAIVHLATHGFVDELRPHLSRLALARGSELTLPDILALGLRADLLVLSACHTGRGRATASGDVLGLARTALASGVRHLIVSLWPVDDVSACLTMVALHDRLACGDDVATALSGAQRLVRAMDGEARAEAYRKLAGTGAVSRTRDLGATGTGDRGNAVAHWAPFVHIGA